MINILNKHSGTYLEHALESSICNWVGFFVGFVCVSGFTVSNIGIFQMNQTLWEYSNQRLASMMIMEPINDRMPIYMDMSLIPLGSNPFVGFNYVETSHTGTVLWNRT